MSEKPTHHETPPDVEQRLAALEEQVQLMAVMFDNAGIRPETHGPKEE